MDQEKKDSVIFWIDDRDDDMEQIVEGMFCELWKRGISNKTLFFGDAVREVDDERLSEYRGRVADEFQNLFVLYDGDIENMEPDEKKICSNLRAISEKDLADDHIDSLANWLPLNEDKIADVVKKWKIGIDKETWESEKELSQSYNLEELWKRLAPKINGTVALDVVLLEGDERKLNCKEDDACPVISMEFYYHITKKLGHQCVLYSKYTSLNRLQNNWKKLYKARYGDLQKELKIYSRRALYKGQINWAVLSEILKHISEEGEADNGDGTEGTQ